MSCKRVLQMCLTSVVSPEVHVTGMSFATQATNNGGVDYSIRDPSICFSPNHARIDSSKQASTHARRHAGTHASKHSLHHITSVKKNSAKTEQNEFRYCPLPERFDKYDLSLAPRYLSMARLVFDPNRFGLQCRRPNI